MKCSRSPTSQRTIEICEIEIGNWHSFKYLLRS
jgi:hypothetical protein